MIGVISSTAKKRPTSWERFWRRRPHFYTEMSYQRNQASLPGGDFDLDLVGLRLHYGFNINLFFDGLIQYNTDNRTINSNLRLNLIHRPLSNLYLVYNDNRNSWDRSILDARWR